MNKKLDKLTMEYIKRFVELEDAEGALWDLNITQNKMKRMKAEDAFINALADIEDEVGRDELQDYLIGVRDTFNRSFEYLASEPIRRILGT
jgi:hypothetical protein